MSFPFCSMSPTPCWGMVSALAGLAVAALLAFLEKDLLIVALSACGTVFVAEWLQRLLAG